MSPASSTQTVTATVLNPRRLLASSVVLAVILGWLFWDFLSRQVLYSLEHQADWGHTLVIPFIAGWLAWQGRGRLKLERLKPAPIGFVLMLVGVGWYTLCALSTALHHHNLMGGGIALTLLGLLLVFFGWRGTRWMLLPLAYLVVFGQFISDRFMEIVTFRMQDIAAVGSGWGLLLIGFDVERTGNVLEIFFRGQVYPLNIAEACSGMRMLMAFFALGTIMAVVGLRHPWQQIALVVMGVPTAIFVNILRVMTLGVLAIRDSGFAAGDFHTFVGLLWLVPAFLIYLGISWVLRNLVIETAPPPSVDPPPGALRFEGRIRGVFIGACSLLIVGSTLLQAGVTKLNLHLQKEPVHLRHALTDIPATLGPWRLVGEDFTLDVAGVEALGTPFYLNRLYARAESGFVHRIQVHVAYYTGQIDAIPHVPDRCMVASGFTPRTPEPANLPLTLHQERWTLDPSNDLKGVPYPVVTLVHPVTREQIAIHLPVGDFALRTTEFVHPSRTEQRVYAGFFFIANGQTTPLPGRIRLLAYDARDRFSYYCKVQFTMVGGEDIERAHFVEQVESLLEPMLPHLMRCLPDWSEITSEPTT